MIDERMRATDEQALLNPAFLGLLIFHAARGHLETARREMPLEQCFLALPLVLRRAVRESLPHAVTTSLPVWLEAHPMARLDLAGRARFLMPFVRQALLIGATHGLLYISGAGVGADSDGVRKVRRVVAASTDEIRECARRAEFVGRWFGRTGDSATVFWLFGVRP